MPEIIRTLPALIRNWIRPNFAMFLNSMQPKVWLLSLMIGLAVSVAAILFREFISIVQFIWLGDGSENTASAARKVHWIWILLMPTLGGLLVGYLLTRFTESRRTGGVADVMEARALGGRDIKFFSGVKSSIITGISLGSGGSAGREGPMVHLGATISSTVAHYFILPGWARRTLLACGVAAAISASFNAPIAGVLFAHEVILRHYAMQSFVPIVISSVAGTILSRLWFSGNAAFSVPDYAITSFWEFPAFAILGIVCAAVAILFQFLLIGTDYIARNIQLPLWIRPAIGGFLVGIIALAFPEVLGVGYEATDLALRNKLPLLMLFALLFAKAFATAITLASRFGGGVVAPSLYLGAMAGGAFGLIAAKVFPELASSQGLYSILGMGAVAAAVLGAPFSTTVMVFELTGGYALSVALLLAVSISAGLNQAIHGRSFFESQLETRGLLVHDGPHRLLMKQTRVIDFMTPLEDGEEVEPLQEDATTLAPTDTLETALRTFDTVGFSRLPVVEQSSSDSDPKVIGWAVQVRALSYFNSALIDASVEEHR